jgi:hypothetical protein
VYYGIHELFPNREPRYVTFLRDPVKRTFSQFNFDRMRLKGNLIPEGNARKRKFRNHTRRGKFVDFRTWAGSTEEIHDFLCKKFSQRIFDTPKDNGVDKKMLARLKDSLGKFYFVGITERPESFKIVYNLFNVKEEYGRFNVTHERHVMPTEEDIEFVRKICEHDNELYKHCIKLNDRFMAENEELVKTAMRKGPSTQKLLQFCKCGYYDHILCPLYRFSSQIRRRSKLYSKTLDAIKKRI